MNVPRGSSARSDVTVPGRWPSDFSAAQAVAASADYSDLCCVDGALWWLTFRPQQGDSVLQCWQDGVPRTITPQGHSVRSRVYEYGGGSFCVLPGEHEPDCLLVFVNEADQQLYLQCPEGQRLEPLTSHPECRYGGLCADLARRRVLAVEEAHLPGRVEHRLVAIGLDGSRQLLASSADFYHSPQVSDDGTQLAWIEWDRPDLSWTRTRLMRASLAADGSVAQVQSVDGADDAWQQPRFDASGQLCCLSDRSGYWVPWQVAADGPRKLPAIAADHAPAPWQQGSNTWLPLEDGWMALSWSEAGYGHLALRHSVSAEERRLAHAYSRFRHLCSDGKALYCIGASPSCTAAILRIELATGELTRLLGEDSALDDADLSRPERLLYLSAGGESAHGFFYPPRNHAQQLDQPPPLLIFTHGGPTSACYPVLDNRIQFWTQRGFAVADLNYRGSTGFGRAYRQRLQGNWGVTDVEDVLAAVDYLSQQDKINPAQVFIRGSSAGGYTTLCSLVAGAGRFRAAASLYGVSDPLQLRAVTHKFEADYIDWLIGDPDTQPERYVERSPLAQADRIRTPVIFFQGLRDAVVLPSQTEQMVAALDDNGVPVHCVTFADERHGFRQAAHLAQVLEEELAFYQAWL
ncbi:alpha/beta hydrolase family protein [Halopseudomonas oceani]|uniref:S9 family peptidase n=1 Tax=Halopseudomonas oceani TaxID=1708783 RepID=A0A2P4EZ86_9GAMM|nr:prolyl oligopeptidase family serine peptidase [Halopseudomonas oceani]POB05803.1 S9 family peptidase [Halopseudomonas oceani]